MIALTPRSGLLVSVLLSSGAAPAQPLSPAAGTSLRLRFVAGQRSPYVGTTTQTMSGPAGRMEIQTRGETVTLRVNPDGSALQTFRVSAVDVRGENLAGSALRGLSRALTGAALEYTQNTRGQTSSPRTLVALSPELRPVLDSLSQSLEEISPELPENPVRVGESWTTRRVVRVSPNAGGSLEVQYEILNTLHEIQTISPAPLPALPARARGGPVALIDLRITLRLPAGSNASGVPVTGDGSASGTLTLDLGRGVVLRARSEGTLRLRLEVAGRAVHVDTRFENDLRAE